MIVHLTNIRLPNELRNTCEFLPRCDVLMPYDMNSEIREVTAPLKLNKIYAQETTRGIYRQCNTYQILKNDVPEK